MPKLKAKSRFRPSRPLVRCAVCGQVYAGVVPPGDTDEKLLPWKHNGPDGFICDGIFEAVPQLETGE